MVEKIGIFEPYMVFPVGKVIDGITDSRLTMAPEIMIGDIIVFDEKESRKLFEDQNIYIVDVNAIIAKIKSKRDLKEEENFARKTRAACKTKTSGRKHESI